MTFVPLALLMALVTYPSRVLSMLVPGLERLPRRALVYLRLVGPATLAALAGANSVLATDASGRVSVQLGLVPAAVVVAALLVAWRRNLFLGIIAAVMLVAVGRAVGLG